jgi:predicted TIM-barrel fold metal-dependent hydrolase
MTIVDSHAHVWPVDAADYPWDHALSNLPTFSAPLHSLLEAMDGAGVGKAVLIQHSIHGYDNRYVLDCARRHPDRFCTVIKVDPLARSAPEQLRQLAETHNVQGLRLHAAAKPDSTWLSSAETYPLWEMAGRLGIVIGILLDPRQLGQAHEIISRFPQVSVIIDHMGRANVDEPADGQRFQQLLDLAELPNVYVKVSGFYALSKQKYPYHDMVPYVRALWQRYGRERLMWATDFPYLVRAGETYAQATTVLRHHLPQLTEGDMAWLMGKTALRLFRFGLAR